MTISKDLNHHKKNLSAENMAKSHSLPEFTDVDAAKNYNTANMAAKSPSRDSLDGGESNEYLTCDQISVTIQDTTK